LCQWQQAYLNYFQAKQPDKQHESLMQMLVAASGMNRDQANTLPAIELKKYCDEMLNPA